MPTRIHTFRSFTTLMMRFACRCSLIALCSSILSVSARAEAPVVSPEQAAFFENEVRPLLVEHCFECHNEDDQSGELRLDSLAWVLAGGESGDAVVPGKPEASLLVQAINYETLEMPPSGKLSNSQIKSLTTWVKMGVPWPGSDPNAPVRKKHGFDEEDRQWWAVRPVAKPPVPDVAPDWDDWSRNEIDRFVLRRLVDEGLTPAPEADRRSLGKRLYLDVTGLPPTPEQLDSFITDDAPDAYARLVDQLLDSKAYGEHAARQWLDLVRYADSDGYRADGYRPDAWRYRDYVIRSFNADKPYDRFTQEQIAGDELFPADTDAQIALGYLRHWVYEWNIRDARTQWKTIVEDLTDTTADVFMGLGLQCAKCHNHKFDPLLQKDYFRLQAFFAPVMPIDKIVADPAAITTHNTRLRTWETKTRHIRDQIAALEKPYRAKARDLAIDKFPDDLVAIARTPKADQTPHDKQLAYLVQRQVQAEYDTLDKQIKGADKDKLLELRRALQEFDSLKPAALPVAMTVTDVGTEAPPCVLPKRPDEPIEPGVPSIISPDPLAIPTVESGQTTGRRSALARWLTEPNNPLSTRVIVNRVWQSHFGRGLAENTSDFGRLGGPPSHPELLDWLTTTFVGDGWSLKSLHRRLLNSATYRQSTQHPEFTTHNKVDAANKLYWRRDTTRLSAEQIRDSLLAVTGQLQDSDGGKGVLSDSPNRTIYTRVMRNSPDQLLGSFDLPQFFSSNSSRNTTTTAVQSLLMINSDLMLGHARKLAATAKSKADTPETQIEFAWRSVYGRQPTATELSDAVRFVDHQRWQITSARAQTAGTIVETSKLPYRDGQAVKFMVDDPKLQLYVDHDEKMNLGEFTIETFIQLRSIADSGTVRTIVSKWNASNQSPGWRFGVTGKGSRRKPQTLVLQMVGQKIGGMVGEAAIFSDQHVKMNTPYYASASFKPAVDGKPGAVTFFLKDLSNDDEPLLIAAIEHSVTGGFNNKTPLTIGSCNGRNRQTFDGLVDDVRLVAKALDESQILNSVEQEVGGTVGFWRFESDPGVMQNSASPSLHLIGSGDGVIDLPPDQAALSDFCHALLNSNEFLYVH